MAQVLLLLSLSFGVIIVLGCALVLIDDRIEGRKQVQVRSQMRAGFRRPQVRTSRSRLTPAQLQSSPREVGYEPHLFPPTPRPSAR